MPTYDYRCASCKKKFAVTRTWAEFDKSPRPRCPKCGKSKNVEQVLGSVLVKTSNAKELQRIFWEY